MPSSYTAIFTHIIFSTKNRELLLQAEWRPRLFEYIGGICRNIKCPLLDAGGMDDHVHLQIKQHPSVSTSDALRDIKANSSRWIHETFPELRTFHWQDGGGLFSVSASAVEDVARYIAHQEEHHKNMTFKEEYLEFLRRHRVEFDPRYVFE